MNASIGSLRRRMQLESPVDVPDEAGGFARTWQSVADIWANLASIRASDEFAAQHGEMSITHRIVLRWRPDITGAMRLRLGTRVFQILTATDADPQRRFIVCQCRETLP